MHLIIYQRTTSYEIYNHRMTDNRLLITNKWLFNRGKKDWLKRTTDIWEFIATKLTNQTGYSFQFATNIIARASPCSCQLNYVIPQVTLNACHSGNSSQLMSPILTVDPLIAIGCMSAEITGSGLIDNIIIIIIIIIITLYTYFN